MERLGWSIGFLTSVLLALGLIASCSRHDDRTPAEAKGKGRVTIVYHDNDIPPENRETIKKIRDLGVFERMADCLTKNSGAAAPPPGCRYRQDSQRFR